MTPQPHTTDLSSVANVLRAEQPVAVLTGAGISTDSGIPDYRGAGSPPRTPMSIDEFMTNIVYRRRFWAGASLHAQRGRDVQPNEGHLVLAALEARGFVNGVITQNVDGLHREAGTQRLVELHGSGHTIRCTGCHNQFSRHDVISWFLKANPGYLDSQAGTEIAPDGDAPVTDYERLTVPVCPICTSVLRPEVVYFGETVPTETFAAAESLVREAGALLVIGSSLAVNTGIRLVNRAEERGLPIVVINRGKTMIDRRATLRIEGGSSETLSQLLRMLDESPGGPAR